MLDIDSATEALNGVKMELIDAAFPLLEGLVATIDVSIYKRIGFSLGTTCCFRFPVF
uniref:Uncharacterized protein n=1 Tax=Cucumis sativus TaxID=3659 RepID=A0A0A0LHT2_CUCSA